MAGEHVFNVTRALVGGGMNVGGVTNKVLADGFVPFKKIIPAGSVKVEIDIAFDITKVKAISMSSSQPCTLYTNDATTPIDTIPLLAGGEIVYVTGADPIASRPLSASVTKMFVSVPGAVDALVQILVPVDVTPVLA